MILTINLIDKRNETNKIEATTRCCDNKNRKGGAGMKKQLKALSLVTAASMLLMACGSSGETAQENAEAKTEETEAEAAESAEGDTIRIGVVTTLSGANSGHGEYCKEGAELWKNQVNENGGILGKQVEIIYEDNGETEQSYVNAMVKCLTNDNVSAIFSNGYSSQIELVCPEVQNYEIPLIGGCSSQSLLEKGYDYFWMLRLSDQTVSPAMVTACKDLGMKNPAILHVSDSYGQGMADFVEQAITDQGMTCALKVSVSESEKQFTPVLTQIINSGADGLIAINHQDQAALVMMQVDAMELDIPLMGCSQYATALAMDTAGDAANGWYSLADWTCQTSTEEGKAFVEAYREAYNRDPDMQSVCAYDAMKLIEDAMIRSNSTDPKVINEAIKETKDLKGAMTTYTYTTDHSLGTSIFMVQTEDKTGVLKGEVHR